MLIKKLTGTGVAIVTPFRKDGSIDFQSLKNLTEHLINNNADYIVVMGTTGESATLSKDEKQAVINYISEINDNRVPIVVGIGGNNTREVIDSIKSFGNFEGIDAVLSVTPYYNKPSQKGIFEHYRAIASVCPKPIIIYNVPGRTGVNISSETTIKIANEIENIIATKEAAGDVNQVLEILRDKPKDFMVISGDDNLAMTTTLLGGSGVISVIGNAYPKQMSDMIKYALNKDVESAVKIQKQLLEITNSIFVEGNPSGIKALLSMMDLIPNYLRLPLVPVSKSHYIKLQKLAAEIK